MKILVGLILLLSSQAWATATTVAGVASPTASAASVSTATLAPGSVTTPKVAFDAIIAVNIINSAITTPKLHAEALDPGGDLLLQTSGGNVGIGAPSPSANLHIGDNTGAKDIKLYGSGKIRILANSDGLNYIQSAVDDVGGSTSKLLFTGLNGTPIHMVIEGGSNVGIGISDPVSRLDVNGGIRADFITADPCGGAAFPEGTMFYNDTSDYYCFCDGAGVDVQMHSPATACF